MQLPITIEQGATWNLTLTYTVDGAPVDLHTGWTAKMQVRESTVDSGAPALITLTHTDGITLSADGTILLDLTPTQTTALNLSDNRGEWELYIKNTASGDVTVLGRGPVQLVRDVAR